MIFLHGNGWDQSFYWIMAFGSVFYNLIGISFARLSTSLHLSQIINVPV
jgi:hypothetical protein